MGFGAEVAAVVQHQAFDWLDAPIERVGAKFTPIPFAPVMEQFVVPHAEDVFAAIKRTVQRVATEVKLPRLGQGMESGTVVRWLKQEGDRVEKGEPLYELDTEKVTQEVEAEASGVLLKIAVAGGRGPGRQDGRRDRRGRRGGRRQAEEPTPRRPRRATPQEEGRARRSASRARGGREARAREPQSRSTEAANQAERPRQGFAARPPDRPRARHRSRAARGTGPEGRIVAEDVERAEAAPAGAAAAAPARAAGRGRGRPAHVDPKDDRAPADRGVAGAGLPAHDLGGHDARELGSRGARRAARRTARSRRSPTSSTKVCALGAHAPPRRERPASPATRRRSTRRRTSASRSRPPHGSSCR